jgi:hypothetical protein
MHGSFEMALYWSYLEMNKNDILRQRTIDQIQRILKEAPVNDHFLRLLWKGFAEYQSKWVQSFFQEAALSKRKLLWTTRVLTFLLKYMGLLVGLSELSWRSGRNELRTDARYWHRWPKC